MIRCTLKRVRRGMYATDDWRFVLELVSGQWVLRECGRLAARKPRVVRTSRHGDNSAREAIRWAHPLIRGDRPFPA